MIRVRVSDRVRIRVMVVLVAVKVRDWMRFKSESCKLRVCDFEIA